MGTNNIFRVLRAIVTKSISSLSSKVTLVAFFVLCTLPVGLNMAFLTPLGQVPDEPAHMGRAAGLLRGTILVLRKSADQGSRSGVKVDAALVDAAFGATTAIGARSHVVTEADNQHDNVNKWSKTLTFIDIPNTAMYFPIFYAPASIGIAVGKLFHFLPNECLLIERIFMLSAFLILGSLSLLLTKTGEAWLFAILSLPMTLFLASSLSVDGLLIACACLSVALLTRRSSTKSCTGLFAASLLGLIGAAKIPYAVVLGFALTPLRENSRRKIIVTGIVGALVLFWGCLAYLYTSVPFEKPPYHPGSLWVGDHDILLHQTNPGANLHILLSNLWLFFSLPYDFFRVNGEHLIDEGIGILGLLELQFSDNYYSTWKAILLFSLIGQIFASKPDSPADRSRRNWLDISFILLIISFDVWLIPLSLYLNWTNVGTHFIEGIQGRYFILLLPFFLLCIPRLPALEKIPQPFLIVPALLLGVFDLAFLPQQIVGFFYIH